jgi:hypothetical protein
MAQMLVAKNWQMKECHAATAKTDLRQLTMMEEFEAIADQVLAEALPPGWIRIWDNLGGHQNF